MSELKDKTVKGVAWSAVERFSSQGIQFVFNILIARILLPEDYGVVAMLNIFLAVSQTFIDSGFATALIRKQNRSEADYSTVFWFNVGVSTFFCALLWLTAPAIAAFYKIPLLTKVTRILSLTLVINAFRAVHQTHLCIEMDFKKRAVVTIICVITTGIVGLIMAAAGHGVWALVIQSIAGSILRTILIWIVVRWRPRIIFSKDSFREMFGFGSKLLGSSLLDTLYNNIYTLVIGKAFSPSALGNYNRAESFAAFPSSSATSLLQTVTYPALSSIQNDEERLRSAYKRLLNLSAFVVFPMMVGMAAVADPLIRLLLTDKWEACIIYLQIICFALMLYPIHAINLNILLVKGRSDYFLKLEIIKKIVGIAILCITLPMGLVAMCVGRIISSWICVYINTYYNERLISYGFRKQFKDMIPILILTFTMGAAVWLLVSIIPNIWAQLIVGILAGVVIYGAGSYIFKFPELQELINLIKRK
ncbi:MAG: lipopolysaccharide biosynthesis protein [Bacteroidales bacterium]|nr:lipopolysaccharide biosynthesis protein [Bacteroidales bacterium]